LSRGGEVCRIFDVPISRLGLTEALELCEERGRAGRGGSFFFVNVHSLMESRENAGLREAMASATACFADGMPLVWVAKRRGTPIASRVCGPDLMRALLSRTPNESHGFIGGAPGTSESLAATLGLTATTHYAPPMRDFSEANVKDDLAAFEKLLGGRPWPHWIWIGLGAPKQEMWIDVAQRLRPEVCFFGVGAAFDFLSGTKPRAPAWMQNAGLEWFFRLASEPKRLAGRYARTNASFLKELLTGNELKKR
jgi:N-acetylglucosaminyldiphosphoundecaprenol N-acetyl-beta-D-mannosaminyltransferase